MVSTNNSTMTAVEKRSSQMPKGSGYNSKSSKGKSCKSKGSSKNVEMKKDMAKGKKYKKK